MRKRIDPQLHPDADVEPQRWIDLERVAEVVVSSEDPSHPIEAALLPGRAGGWKAAEHGIQTVRILFDAPQTLNHIHLMFTAEEEPRTQEFVLRWAAGEDLPRKEIVRQQFNFAGASAEVEEYEVRLSGVKLLELEINPSISGGPYFASLSEMRLR